MAEFQVKCKIAAEELSATFLRNIYDKFPPEIRDALKYADFNICDACVGEIYTERGLPDTLEFIKTCKF